MVKLGPASIGKSRKTVQAELSSVINNFGEVASIEVYTEGAYEAHPFANVNFIGNAGECSGSSGLEPVMIFGDNCSLLWRRPSAKRRKEASLAAEAAVRAVETAATAARLPWQPEMLELYPSRATTLDQQIMVSDLSPVSMWRKLTEWPTAPLDLWDCVFKKISHQRCPQ